MYSSPINSLRLSLSPILSVAMLAASVLLTSVTGRSQHLQKGISVEMAVTSGASSLPEADNEDAWIITITQQGDLYFGIDPVTPEQLSEAIKARPRARGQELYVKVDARTPFGRVRPALAAARQNGFARAYLLTAQASGAESGGVVSPKGLPLWITGESSLPPVVVEISPGPEASIFRINHQPVPLPALPSTLEQWLRVHDDRAVVLEPGHVLFADVARVLDICHMSGARAFVSTAEL
jgi:biopolymer transport protein ExbD